MADRVLPAWHRLPQLALSRHMALPPRWHLADLLDFESLLAGDAGRTEEAVQARDRAIAQRHADLGKADRRAAFHHWLEARREAEGSGLPGETVRTGWEAFVAIAVFGGLVLGASVGAAVLRYPGGEPVNVAVFLAAILGPQFVLPLLFTALWVLLRWRTGRPGFSRIICWLGGLLRRLPGEERVRAQTALASLDRRRDLYGSLGKWPLLIATQIFAVTFNLGALGVLLAHVPTRELRFGWQTTLEVSSEQVAPVVALAAAPWQWAPYAHPTAEQVVATRFMPGQSLATLPGEAARAWWPFLAYAIGCYGLLLRALVLIFAIWQLRSALSRVRFDHTEANALWRRLTGPLVALPGASAELHVPASTAENLTHLPQGGAIWLLVSNDAAPPDAELASAAERAHGWHATHTQRVKIDNRREASALFGELAAAHPRPTAVVLAVPAERDPIMAIGLFLRELQHAAQQSEVLVWLVGAPMATASDRRKFWRDFLAIQRLPVGVEFAPLP